jgi:hypothetical protein
VWLSPGYNTGNAYTLFHSYCLSVVIKVVVVVVQEKFGSFDGPESRILINSFSFENYSPTGGVAFTYGPLTGKLTYTSALSGTHTNTQQCSYTHTHAHAQFGIFQTLRASFRIRVVGCAKKVKIKHNDFTSKRFLQLYYTGIIRLGIRTFLEES